MNSKVKAGLIFFAGVGVALFAWNALAGTTLPVASTVAKKVTGKA